jgi:hypothetical protein
MVLLFLARIKFLPAVLAVVAAVPRTPSLPGRDPHAGSHVLLVLPSCPLVSDHPLMPFKLLWQRVVLIDIVLV